MIQRNLSSAQTCFIPRAKQLDQHFDASPTACSKMDEEAPLVSAWNPLEVINDFDLAIEVAESTEGPGPWRVAYPEGRVQVTGESFQVRLREEEAIAVTVPTSELALGRERKVMVFAVDEEFCRKVDSWLQQEQKAIQEEEKQRRRRAEELEKMTRSSERRVRNCFIVFLSIWSLVGGALFGICESLVWTGPNFDIYDYVQSIGQSAWPCVLGCAMGAWLASLFFCLAWALPNTKVCQVGLLNVALAISCLYTVFYLFRKMTLTRDTHEVPPDLLFAVCSSWGPVIGTMMRQMCLADGLFRQRWRREAENHVRDGTILFEGKISEEPGTACIASWPGLYATAWHYLARQARGGQTSAAVVFLPKGTQYYGNHSPIPEKEGLCGACWCFALYGEEKEWGCQWWSVWIENVYRAMVCGAVLHVYFWEGLRGKGKVASFATVGQENLVRESVRKKIQDFERSKEYENAKQAGLLKLSDRKRYDGSSQQSREVQRLFRTWLPPEERSILEDAEGLGDSQRAEVAWLDRKGYPYIEMDVSPFLQPSDEGDAQDQEARDGASTCRPRCDFICRCCRRVSNWLRSRASQEQLQEHLLSTA